MKKLMLLILAVLLVIGFCSCKESRHRKLQFDDGESFCFNGCCTVSDGYIKVRNSSGIFDISLPVYFSATNREYTITECDCENINT